MSGSTSGSVSQSEAHLSIQLYLREQFLRVSKNLEVGALLANGVCEPKKLLHLSVEWCELRIGEPNAGEMPSS